MNKVLFSILNLFAKHDGPLTSGKVCHELELRGVTLSERTVRYYLKMLDEYGFTEPGTGKGRRITEDGRYELNHGLVSERVGFIANRINNLSFLCDFSLEARRGKVILNTTFVPETKIHEALEVMSFVLTSPYATSNRMVLRRGGERLGDLLVPLGTIGIGTVCSITVNSIFLKAGIPVTSRFGGIVEIVDNMPTRFLSVISYEASSIAPLEIFMKSKMTDVLGTLKSGTGRILGSFREIPEVSLPDARRLDEKMKEAGFDGIILFGKPGEQLLGIPVTAGRVGLVVLGGLNPVTVLEEAEIPTESHAMATLADYLELSAVQTYEREWLGTIGVEKAELFERLWKERLARSPNYWSVFDALKQSTL
jgi:HTH-type transcriptional regulator, global nitrogen regulator NrpRI